MLWVANQNSSRAKRSGLLVPNAALCFLASMVVPLSAFVPIALRPCSRSLPVGLFARTAAAQSTNFWRDSSASQKPRLRGGTGGLYMSTAAEMDTLDQLVKNADHSWLRQLNPDPDTEAHAPNKESREVKSGHYVRLLPTALRDPKLVIHSEAMAKSLGIAEKEVKSERFAKFFSGDQSQLPGMECWATPYALSIMGERHTRNCPFGNGNGYGDGRAQSVGEVVVDNQRWELQLKGGGRTPFCRGADGRAVLRSSVREFLASELMWALGISTTRALSLVVSETETTRRPWYSGQVNDISVDDPRLAQFPPEQRAMLVAQLRARGGRDPDVMIEESCAITTRVAPSFLRVGHVDLFSRRVQAAGGGAEGALRREELEKLVEHALFREYEDVAPGFCQGNFNADNCLVGGRTMDYGPFGFMEQYDPLFAKWVGSGEHFAFLNQPNAALANFHTLASSVAPILPGGEADAKAALLGARDKIQAAVHDTWRRKLGFRDAASADTAQELFSEAEGLLRSSKADWTLFWRQLSAVAVLPLDASDAALLAPLDSWSDKPGAHSAWYAPLPEDLRGKWLSFLRKWRNALDAEGHRESASERMNKENPKYIAREWMLVEAYDAAKQGDYSIVHELHELFKDPYGEGSSEQTLKYYRTAPAATLERGGTAFMS